jgi:hypothetical protein
VLATLGRDVEVMLVNASSLDGGFFSLEGLDHLTVGTEAERRRLALSGARGWVRRLAAPGWRPGVVAGSRSAAERTAFFALTVALASHPAVQWLTPYACLVAIENKVRQGAYARRLGIRTPRTVVVSDPLEIPARLGNIVVAKPLGPGHFIDEDGEAQVIWATAIARDDPRLAALGGAPFMIQERLRARRHLRVVTCGRHTWTCELGADALPLDWRSDEDAHGGFVPTREPAVEAWALSLASELGVGYSSQDWIDDGEDDPAFIDLNPAGQWLFLPEPVSSHVTEAIAAHLAGA